MSAVNALRKLDGNLGTNGMFPTLGSVKELPRIATPGLGVRNVNHSDGRKATHVGQSSNKRPFCPQLSGFQAGGQLTGKTSLRRGIRRGGREKFLKRGENIRNAERFLQMTRLAGTPWRVRRFDQLSRHKNDRWFAISGCGEEALRGHLATQMATMLREVQIAKKYVMRTLGDEVQRFFQRGGAVNMQPPCGKPFEEQAAEALFIVQHEDGATLQEIECVWQSGARKGWGGRR